ncbi:tetratricopeptide repeat-containing protein [Streptomyces zhihengii]
MTTGDDELAGGLAALARDLAILRIENGNPSLRTIEREAPANRPLSPSAVSEVLNGKRLPRIDFLMALVHTLIAHGSGGRPPQRRDPRLDVWRVRWRELQLLQATHRLSLPPAAPTGPAGSLAEPAAGDGTADTSPPADDASAEETPRPAVSVSGTDHPVALRHDEVRVFVAMPGSTMGDTAGWSSIPEIRRRLLEPVTTRIGEILGRPAALVVEKEKTATGAVHRSMFAEALDADVYIADLTGGNANVYLELGVRWALRDGVTVPISQDVGDVRFNASSSRVIPYGPMPDQLDDAIRRIADAAASGLRDPRRVDSPVRDGADLVVVERAELEELRHEIRGLREAQAEDLVEAALRSSSKARRVELLRLAVARNPASWRGYFELGVALRTDGWYDEAEDRLRTAVTLKEDFAPAWREIGLTLSKGGAPGDDGPRYEAATQAFDRALALDGDDPETWANLGGLHRRRARTSDVFDETALEKALVCYRNASRLSGNSTYPLMNTARVQLLLSAVRHEDLTPVVERLRQLHHLALFAVHDSEGRDPWALFDLADTLLLTGRGDEGLTELDKAIARLGPSERDVAIASVAEPFRDLLRVADRLPDGTADAVRSALAACAAAATPSAGP